MSPTIYYKNKDTPKRMIERTEREGKKRKQGRRRDIEWEEEIRERER